MRTHSIGNLLTNEYIHKYRYFCIKYTKVPCVKMIGNTLIFIFRLGNKYTCTYIHIRIVVDCSILTI